MPKVARIVARYTGIGVTWRSINSSPPGRSWQAHLEWSPYVSRAALALAAISRHPAHSDAPAGVTAAQGRAVNEWRAGTDPAGREDTRIFAPALVADGTADRLDPVANSRALARLIRHTRLMLYPDAGHAFMFQD